MAHNFSPGRFEYRDIHGLKPWQVYHFSLRYETIVGPSSWSYIISAQTKAEGMCRLLPIAQAENVSTAKDVYYVIISRMSEMFKHCLLKLSRPIRVRNQNIFPTLEKELEKILSNYNLRFASFSWIWIEKCVWSAKK